LIAGNWKMNLTLKESVELARAVKEGAGQKAEVAVYVPATALPVVSETLKGSTVRVGAQNVYWEEKGAFTGEIAPAQAKDAGASSTLIGHSERRKLFGDTDENINKKLKAALKAGLVPVVCVGETLDERESQATWRVLETQMKAIAGFAPAELSTLVIAYEPVWAIGTGKTATPEQAQEAHLFIRKQAAKLYNEGFAAGLRILYGGSVTPENVDGLMAKPDIDGALVGGASLKAPSFLRIVNFQ
jgi:triosephosphate isomerase